MGIVLELSGEAIGHLDEALGREWLATNGLGGYASSSIVCANTRRYHGLLFADLGPPLGRILTLSKLEETALVEGGRFPLSTNEYHDGTIHPQGYQYLSSFRLEEGLPVFHYRLPGAELEKRVFMPHGRNATYITYSLSPGSLPLSLELVPLCTHRGHHALTQGGSWQLSPAPIPDGVRIDAYPGARPYFLLAKPASFQPGGDWYWRFLYRGERERGLGYLEDLYAVGTIHAELAPGRTLTVAASLEPEISLDGEKELEAEWARRHGLLEEGGWEGAPAWVRQLVLASDQFLVSWSSLPGQQGRAIIAGYPWFEEWGRDTSVSLPGLTLTTHRFELAREILQTQAGFLESGQIPNICPAFGSRSAFNSADASFWYIHAVERYFQATQDREFLAGIYPVLAEMLSCHQKGVCPGIQMDSADGLLRAELPGLALTWMDARVGGQAVTPRAGKPVELNALWFNALKAVAGFARTQGLAEEAARYEGLAWKARQSFNQKFWYAQGGYLYDVIEGPEGNDASLRPNQVIALSLPHRALPVERSRRALEAVERELLTPYGLRTLSPRDNRYRGHYAGDWSSRDRAYHQGTAWAWLLGPFVSAHYRIHRHRAKALSFLSAMEDHLKEAGIGTIGEVFDGDPPHHPGGTIAQAWSVAEILRAWAEVSQGLSALAPAPPKPKVGSSQGGEG